MGPGPHDFLNLFSYRMRHRLETPYAVAAYVTELPEATMCQSGAPS